MILHTPETITIRRYARFEKSKDLRLLFRVRVPMWIALKYSYRFIEAFNLLFNSNSETDMEDEMHKLITWNKIMLMQAILMGIQVHLSEKVQIDLLKTNGKPKAADDPVLANYLNEAEQCTGIKIETLEDIAAFKSELERLTDKFAELYPVKEVKQSNITIMQLCFSVESLMNMRIDYDKMTLAEFYELKQMADERAKQMQESIKKMKNG